MSKKNLPVAEIDHEVINNWKKEYGDVRRITVSDTTEKFDPFIAPSSEDEEVLDGKMGYLRKPTDRELSFAMSKLPVMLDAGKVILKSCWLGGDAEMLQEGALMNSAAMEALTFLEVRKSKMVKL